MSKIKFFRIYSKMKYTKNYLDKIEGLLTHSGYKVRYEKGQFKGGYCILEEQGIIVVNKFFPLEGKINTLLEAISLLSFDQVELDADDLKLIEQLKQTKIKI